MLVPVNPLRQVIGETFAKAGCAGDEAERIALHLVGANLAGHDSHGVIRVPRYLEWLGLGRLVPGQTVTIITDSPSMAVVDGGWGFGQTVGPQAVQIGIDKANDSGVAIVGLRNSGHLGRIGDWAEMAAEAGLVSVHFVNVSGSLLVAPFGARGRRMATNPVAAGVPRPDGPPLILDFATSVVAEGKVLVAAKGGKALPAGALIDGNGALSADPKALYGGSDPSGALDYRAGKGALRAMGEHKGSGLSFFCELLAGALTGSGTAGPGERRLANGMLSFYISVEAFDEGGAFADEVGAYIDFFKSAEPAEPGGEVLTPGEPEERCRAERTASGIPLPSEVWQALRTSAVDNRVDAATIDAAFSGG